MSGNLKSFEKTGAYMVELEVCFTGNFCIDFRFDFHILSDAKEYITWKHCFQIICF